MIMKPTKPTWFDNHIAKCLDQKPNETDNQYFKRIAGWVPLMALVIIPYSFIMQIFRGRYL